MGLLITSGLLKATGRTRILHPARQFVYDIRKVKYFVAGNISATNGSNVIAMLSSKDEDQVEDTEAITNNSVMDVDGRFLPWEITEDGALTAEALIQHFGHTEDFNVDPLTVHQLSLLGGMLTFNRLYCEVYYQRRIASKEEAGWLVHQSGGRARTPDLP